MQKHGPGERCAVCKDCNFAISTLAERADAAEARLKDTEARLEDAEQLIASPAWCYKGTVRR